MAGSSQSFRRWSGAVYLSVAIIMAILGATVLDGRLQGMTFIYYWLACAMLTLLTLMIALLDFRAVRRQSREEQNELIQEVLDTVADHKARSSANSEVKNSHRLFNYCNSAYYTKKHAFLSAKISPKNRWPPRKTRV